MFGKSIRKFAITGAVLAFGIPLAGEVSPAQAQYYHADHGHPSYKKVRKLFGLHGHVINNGFLVKEVEPGSPAQLVGLYPGDFVTVLDGTAVTDIETFCREILEDFADDDDMTMTFIRNGFSYNVIAKF